MNRCLYFLIIVLTFYAQSIGAQSKVKNKWVEKAIIEANKIKQTNLDSAKAYLILFNKTHMKSIPNELGPIEYQMGEFSLESANYDSAKWYYDRALSKLAKVEDEYYMARTYIGLGYISSVSAKRQISLDYYFRAEKLLTKNNDTQLLGRIYKKMGDIYQAQNDYLIAREYFGKGLQVAEQYADTLNMIRALNALTTAYDHFEQYEQTENTLKRAIELADKINCIRCMAISYSQLGISYFQQKRFKEAIEVYNIEYKLNKRLKSYFDQFFVFQNTSEAFVGLKQYDQALIHSDSAGQILKTEHFPQYLYDFYEVRYKIYKGLNNPSEALEALEMQMAYKDSLFNADKTLILENMRNNYETEIKEQRILDLENETKIKALEATSARLWRLVLLVFLILLAIVLSVLYYRYILNKKTAKATDERNAVLKETNQFKDRMFAIISHDLKSPLSSFSSITSTLNEYYDQIKPQDVKGYLQKLAIASRSLEEQMKNLLEWSIKQMADRELIIEPVNLLNTLNSLRDIFSLNLEIKNQVLGIEIPRDMEILTDKEYLMTILRNLVSNAIKFTPKGGSLWIKTEKKGDKISISIQDSGIGIAQEDFEKLFSLSADKKSIGTSPEKGTGLGLVLVKELTSKLGGELEFQSEMCVGTTFSIIFLSNSFKYAA